MVLVCHKHRFIFLKTTKTAGTSTEKALQPLCEAPGMDVLKPGVARESKYGIVGARGSVLHKAPPKWQFWRKYPWRNHMPASEVKSNLGRTRFEQYTKYGNVRNPFDRAVSQFHFMKHLMNLPSEDPQTEIKQFKEFIRSEEWFDDWNIVSVDNTLVIDSFITKENLVGDLTKIFKGYGLSEDSFKLPHDKSMRERRKGIPVPDYFDSRTIDIVRRKMAWVFEALPYPEQPQDDSSPETVHPLEVQI
ncbi:sulfotransferase family 2 domain-containing protein [Ruegeria arenilitoris]|uniref:sulfotransferase family 2 domain-containing protein n=1 Tax=Ruegeria arenilitoris TaxID=1173585 RepID=UPI0014815A2D|nr:sulfotransferase family 2 domain-containing protein [Ruegeria arenilitoris]